MKNDGGLVRKVELVSMLVAFVCSLVCVAPALAQETKPELVIKVGPGGLTQQELDIYLRRAAKRLRRSKRDLDPADRERAITEAIDDEILYQAAVAGKMLEDEHVKSRICNLYKSKNTTAKIDPRSFTSKELRAYYDTHPEEFTKPVELELSVLRIPRCTAAELREILRKAKAVPERVEGWKRIGWASQSKVAANTIPKRALDPLYRLYKGEVHGPVEDRFGMRHVFWVHGRKEARLVSFEKSRARVVHLLIKQKQASFERRMRLELRGDRPSERGDSELLYEAALAAGMARDWGVRKYVINAWVARQKQTRDDLLIVARRRFRVVR
jgi:hypothetical protein